MPVSEDGVPYGSFSSEELDSAKPKTDEAKAQHEALKARAAEVAEEVAEESAEESEAVA